MELDLSKYNPRHAGRAFALLSVYGEQQTEDRRCVIPTQRMVLWEYAPGRTARHLEEIDNDTDNFDPPDVIEYIVGDEPYYVPTTHYHHIFAQIKRGKLDAEVIIRGIDQIDASRFYINDGGLWEIVGPQTGKLVVPLSDMKSEMGMILDMGVKDYRESK